MKSNENYLNACDNGLLIEILIYARSSLKISKRLATSLSVGSLLFLGLVARLVAWLTGGLALQQMEQFRQWTVDTGHPSFFVFIGFSITVQELKTENPCSSTYCTFFHTVLYLQYSI